MKNILLKALLIVSLLIFGTATTQRIFVQASASEVTFESTPNLSITSDVPFTTTVSIKGADQVVGFQLQFLYDVSRFTIQNIAKTANLPANIVYNIDNPGIINLNYSYTGATIDGDVPLFTITFLPGDLGLGSYELLQVDDSYDYEVTRDLLDLKTVPSIQFDLHPVRSGMYGDVNGDNQVTIMDVGIIQLYLAGKYDFSAEQLELADVSVDGKVSILDVGKVQLFLAGLLDILGPDPSYPPVGEWMPIDEAWYVEEGTEVTISGHVTFVNAEGFYLRDGTGSIFIRVNGAYDLSGLLPWTHLSVTGERHWASNQAQLINPTEPVEIQPADVPHYPVECFATIKRIQDSLPENLSEYGVIYETGGILVEDSGYLVLVDKFGSGATALISEMTDAATYAELASLVGSTINLTVILYGYDADMAMWQLAVIPGTIQEEAEQIRQTIVIPVEVVEYYTLLAGGEMVDTIPSEVNSNVLHFYVDEGITEVTVNLHLMDGTDQSQTIPVDLMGDHIHFFGVAGETPVYTLIYASDYDLDFYTLISQDYYIDRYWFYPEYTTWTAHKFGEMVWIAPDPNAYENYIYCGAHVGIDMSSDAVPDLITVTGDLGIYYFWDIEPEAIKHIVRWHHDGTVDGVVTERIYPEGFWIDQWMDTPYSVREQHGYWFEGWFLDTDFTIPFTQLEVSANMDIYPKLIPASERTIADVKAISPDEDYPFVSVSGIVTYVSIDRLGNIIGLHLTDGTETLIVSSLSTSDYIPTIGDEILVSGVLYRPFESSGIDVVFLQIDDYTILEGGTGSVDYSGAVDIMTDYNAGTLVGQKLYTIEGQILATFNLDSGIVYYSIQTADGTLFNIHSQSTHYFDGESFIHCMADYADLTGRLTVYYAWYSNGFPVVFAVPGEFEELDPIGPNPNTIRQTILIPWAVIDGFQIEYNGKTALVEPSLNPNLVTVYLEEGTTEFTVTWFQGELSQSFTLAVNLTEDAIHSFEYDGATFWYLLDFASTYGLSLEELIGEVFNIYYHDYAPDYTFYSGYLFGEMIYTSNWAGDNYILNGVYFDEDNSQPAPEWVVVKGNADLYYDWGIIPGANTHQVRWHHDATEDGAYTDQVFAEAYVVHELMDTPYFLSQQHGYWFEGWYLDTELTIPFTGQELFEDLDIYPKLIPAAERTIADALAADPDLEEQYVSVNGTVSYISMDSTGNIISVLLSDGTGTIVVSGIYNFDYQPTLGDQLLVSGIIVRPFGTYIDCNWIYLSAYTLVMPGDGTADYSGAEDIMNDFQNGTLVYSKLYTITGTISSITNPETGITGYYITTSEGQRFTLHSQSTYLFDGLNYIHCAAEYDGMYGVLTVYYAWMDTIVFAIPGQFVENI